MIQCPITSQAFPLPSATNIITATLQTDFAVTSSIQISGIENLACPTPLTLFADNVDNPGNSLFCVGSTPNLGTVVQGVVVMQLCSGSELDPYDERIVSFACLNPAVPQSPPPVTISVVDGTTTLLSQAMVVDTSDAFGVSQGASVLNIVALSISVQAAQICPLTSVFNYITFSFTSNVNFEAQSTLTISGLTGSQTPTSLTCFQLDPYPDGDIFGPNGCAVWIQQTGTLEMTVQAELQSQISNDVSFTLTNPSYPQSSPAVWVNGSVSGVRSPHVPSPQDAIISRIAVLNDLSSQPFSVVGGAQVLLTIFAAVTQSSISQSNMLPGANNTITVVLTFNCDMPSASVITLSGLTSGNVQNASKLAISSTGNAFGTTAAWAPNLVLTVGIYGTVHGQAYTIQFTVMNPVNPQSSPAVMLTGYVETAIDVPSLSTRAPFNPTALTKIGSSILGVPNATFPLFIVQPFQIKQVVQTSNKIGASNQLNFTLQSNINFLASNSSYVTVTGLTGTQTASNNELPLYYPADDTSNVFGQSANWSQAGILILQVRSVMSAGQAYIFWIQVQNPPKGQAAPQIYISASGTASIIPALMNTTSGVALALSIPDFQLAQMSQSTPNPGTANTLSFNFSVVSALQAAVGYKVSITGFTGGTGTTITMNTGSSAQWKVTASNIALGTLQLTLNTDLNAATLCQFSFYTTNSNVGQLSPNISIALIQGTVTLVQRLMAKSTGNFQPMLINEFVQAILYQSTASQGANVNTITLRLTTLASLTPSGALGQDVIILSNMSGATTASAAALPISDAGTGSLSVFGSSGSWTQGPLKINNVAFASNCMVCFVHSVEYPAAALHAAASYLLKLFFLKCETGSFGGHFVSGVQGIRHSIQLKQSIRGSELSIHIHQPI